MFWLPVNAVDVEALHAYLPGGPASLTTTAEHAILDLWSEVDEPEDDCSRPGPWRRRWHRIAWSCAAVTCGGSPPAPTGRRSSIGGWWT